MKTSFKPLLYISLACAVLWSCDQTEKPASEPRAVSFIVSEETTAGAKSMPATKTSFDTDSMGVIACSYATSNSVSNWSIWSKPDVICAILDSKRGTTYSSGKFVPLPEHRLLWPGEGYIRFFAYMPYKDENNDNKDDDVTFSMTGGAPSITYTVPDVNSAYDNLNQTDLLVSIEQTQYEGDPGWRDIDVPLTMGHALSGIRFRMPTGYLSLEAVNISGIYNKGTMDLSEAWDSKSWNPNVSSTGSYSLSNPNWEDTGDGYKVTTTPILVLPQTLPYGNNVPVISATIRKSLTEVRTVVAELSGEWKPGKIYTYTITQDGTEIVFTAIASESYIKGEANWF